MKRIEFAPWPKTPRLNRDITITEKIDGTNGAIHVVEYDGPDPLSFDEKAAGGLAVVYRLDSKPLLVGAQSRNRLVTPEADNFGFARWVQENAATLAEVLGTGTHYGEWWGSGISRGYGLPKGERRFSLFNVHRYGSAVWTEAGELRLEGLNVVPRLYQGPFDIAAIQQHGLDYLTRHGSEAAPGFMRPEGVIVFHSASQQVYKVLLEGDDVPKGLAA